MLDNKALDRFDLAGLRAYIETLHKALSHVSAASVEAQRFVTQSTEPTKTSGAAESSVAVAALVKALANQ